MIKNAMTLGVGLLLAGAMVSAQTIEVVRPEGGRVLQMGQELVISWTSSALQGRVAVHVMSGGLLQGVVAQDRDVNASFMWTVGYFSVSGEPLSAGTYSVRVVSMQDTAIHADSLPFTVKPATLAYIVIDLPRENETWPIGSRQIIRWRSHGLDQSVILSLFNGSLPVMMISNDQSPSGQFEWTVGQGQLIGTAAIPGAGALLTIEARTQSGYPVVRAKSNSVRIIGQSVGGSVKEKKVDKKAHSK